VGHKAPRAGRAGPHRARSRFRRVGLVGALAISAFATAAPAQAASLNTFSVTRGQSHPGTPNLVFSAMSNFRHGQPGSLLSIAPVGNPPTSPLHDPGASPSLTVSTAFTTTAADPNQVENVTLHLPPGQLGNPHATTLCRGSVATDSAATPPVAGTNPCTTGQQVGVTTVHTLLFPTGNPANPFVPATLKGAIYNADPADTATSPHPDQQIPTAPAALSIVLKTFNAGGGDTALPNPIVQLVPLTLRPRPNNDYGLDSTLHFTPGVDNASLTLFGFLPSCAGVPAGTPCSDMAQNLGQGGLPFIFNPTNCVPSLATLDTVLADGTADGTGESTLPAGRRTSAPANAVGGANAGESVGCDDYLYNGNERATDDAVANHQVPVGNSTVNSNVKVADDDNGRAETPDQYQVRFFNPTDRGMPYASHIKEIDANLPEGTTFSTALANKPGFTACTDQQFDAGAAESASCPAGSRIGNLTVLTPLLDQSRPATKLDEIKQTAELLGGCTQAQAQPENPCGNMTDPNTAIPGLGTLGTGTLDPIGGDVWAGEQIAGHPNQFKVFTEITDGGVTRIKSVGIATADLQTGRIRAVFDDLPQSPFFHLEQKFDGGDHAALVNPKDCGTPVMNTEETPWTGIVPDRAFGGTPATAQPDDRITVSYDGNGAACPAQRPFQPQLAFLADPFTAGQDTHLITSITKDDRSDDLVTTDVNLPDGLVGALASVPLCPRDQARAGTCGDESLIGEVETVVGNGNDPLHQKGKVFLSQPVNNLTAADDRPELARITTVVDPKVGPFDLGDNIIVELALKLRVKDGTIGVDNVGQDKLPTILAGIPIRIRALNLNINRDGFLRNPLTCDAKTGGGTFGSGDGRTVSVTGAFTATGCDTLGFAPKVAAAIGSASQPAAVDSHPPVSTVVTQPDHQAAISKSVVTLPQGLNPNVAALGTLCNADQLSANACPSGSKVGSAKAFSPLLPDPLAGPVYLVENPGGLPKLVIRLGGLFSLDLTGNTALQGGRLVTTLSGLPATPVSRFELNIDGGSRGLFTVSDSLCSATRSIDAAFDSHTGQHSTDSRAVSTVGCTASSASSRRPVLSVRVSRVGKSPLLTVRARRANDSSNRLSTLRLTIPKRFVVVKKNIKKGVRITAGGKKLSSKKFSLSRSGVLTVRGLPKSGRSNITVTIRGGALRAGQSLRGLAVRKRTLPRMTFVGRLVDVKNQRYNYSVRVRPTR
jgi:hypothetical protein